MNEKFVVNNWPDKNKHGAQSWTKLYRAMIEDCRFAKLSMESRAFAPMFLMLASENNGTVYHDKDGIAFKLRISNDEVNFAIDELLNAGYIGKQKCAEGDHGSTINTFICQNEIECEKTSTASVSFSKTANARSMDAEIEEIIESLCITDVEFSAAWNGWLDHRVKMRKPVNTRAKLLHLRLLGERPLDSVRLLNTAMINGWVGLNWSWMDKPFMAPCFVKTPQRAPNRETNEYDIKRRNAF